MRRALTALVLLLAAGSFAAGAVGAAERASIPEQYKWNLTDIYPTDGAWAAAKDEIAKKIPALAKLQGQLGQSAAAFYSVISTITEARLQLDRMSVYASMRQDEDTRDNKGREMAQAAQQVTVDLGAAVSYLQPEILGLGSAKVKEFIAAEPKLAPYKPWLDDVLRAEAHTLDPAQERIVAEAGNLADAGGTIAGVFREAELPYPELTLADGQKVRLDNAAYTQYRAATNREDRDKVFKALFGAYKVFEGTFGAMLNEHVQGHIFDCKVHKFDSSLENALFQSNVPVSVYKQLIADVHANLPTLHRYLKLRQRMMGVDHLRYEDLYAPIVKAVDLRYTAEQAMDITLKAVAPLGNEYVATLKKGFDSHWVDFMPTTGKRSGAYSTGVYGVHPYQLLNFTGIYDEVSTLAHESGHSMHTYLSFQHQPYITSNYVTFVAEVASTCNENLLFHSMLDQTKDRDTRLFLLGAALDRLRTTLFRQTLFAEFEMRIHELAEKGEPLTGEKLSKLYLELVRQYYGHDQGVCGVDELYGVEWAYIPHFYRNFYVFQYATSMVASNSIAAAIRAEQSAKPPLTKARDAYLGMLSSGSSKYPIDLLKGAGVDMTTPAPFGAAMTEMNSIMDEMEKLLK
jgi:oligoendopeptidase F